jgi:hypothetical protein
VPPPGGDQHGRRQCRGQQHPPPGARVRTGDGIPGQIGDGVAGRPHRGEPAEQAAALGPWRELGRQRGGDRVVGADRDTQHEPRHEQPARPGHDELRHRAHDDQCQVQRVHDLPADPVGDIAADQPAGEQADQRGRGEQALPGAAEWH